MKKSTCMMGLRVVPSVTGLALCALMMLVCAGMFGCEGSPATQMTLKQLQQGQQDILKRLDSMEKEIKAGGNKRAANRRPQVDYNKVYDIKVGNSMTQGNKAAKVTLVEFSDMQCPYCKRLQPTIQQLVEAFPNDLKHVFKNFPLRFHKRAHPAAMACLAAGQQGKFWEMHKLVFENAKKIEDEDLKKYAKQIGLNMGNFEKDIKSEALAKQIQQDMADGRNADVRGTPTLFLNGKRVKDRSFEGMKKRIEELLKKAG